MSLQQVNSSNIEAVDYDRNTGALTIRFRSGGTYEYFDVPESVYHGLLSASSHGQYFQREIRGRYRYARR